MNKFIFSLNCRYKQINDPDCGTEISNCRLTFIDRSFGIVTGKFFVNLHFSGVTCDRNNVIRSNASSFSANRLASATLFFSETFYLACILTRLDFSSNFPTSLLPCTSFTRCESRILINKIAKRFKPKLEITRRYRGYND